MFIKKLSENQKSLIPRLSRSRVAGNQAVRESKKMRGDTIVEVLISVAIMSLVLTISYALANRDTAYVRQSQERGEAQKIGEAQLEHLRDFLTAKTDWIGEGYRCFKNDGQPTDDLTECNKGIKDDGEGRYKVNIAYNEPTSTYTVTTRWSSLISDEDQVLKLSYKLPATALINPPDPPTVPPPPPPPVSASETIDGEDFISCVDSGKPDYCLTDDSIHPDSVYSLSTTRPGSGVEKPQFTVTYKFDGLPAGNYSLMIGYFNHVFGTLNPPPGYEYDVIIRYTTSDIDPALEADGDPSPYETKTVTMPIESTAESRSIHEYVINDLNLTENPTIIIGWRNDAYSGFSESVAKYGEGPYDANFGIAFLQLAGG